MGMVYEPFQGVRQTAIETDRFSFGGITLRNEKRHEKDVSHSRMCNDQGFMDSPDSC